MKIGLKPLKRIKINFFIVFLLFFLMISFLSLLLLARFKPIFEEKASHAARVRAIEILNTAIDNVFMETEPGEYVKLSENNGTVTSIVANTSEINKLKSRLATAIEYCTKYAEGTVIHIPLGSLTDYPVLQGIGYRIPVKIVFDGVSKVDFDSEFVHTGINQVKHKICMNASTEFSVISSVMAISETISTEVPISEAVIVGDVPEYYGDKLSVVGR